MSNVVSFKRPKGDTPSLINARYNAFSDAMDATKPTGLMLTGDWLDTWLEEAAANGSPDVFVEVINDKFMLLAMLIDEGLLTRYLNTVRWSVQGHKNNVIFADCEAEAGPGEYPAPMIIYRLGVGVSLSSRAYTFDGEFDPAACLDQSVANLGNRQNIDIISIVLPEGTEVTKHYSSRLIQKLVDVFVDDAVAFQGGVKIITQNGDNPENATELTKEEHSENSGRFDILNSGRVVLSFLHTTGTNSAMEWNLAIDSRYYAIRF